MPPTSLFSLKQLAALKAFEFLWDTEVGKFRSAKVPLPADFKPNINALTKSYMDLWPDVVVEPGVPQAHLANVAGAIIEHEINPGMDRKVFFDYLNEPLEKAYPKSALVALFKGKFLIHYAWDARGGGWANTVTPEGWELFHQRLAEAQAALELAWNRDTTNPQIPVKMMTVGLGQSWPLDKLDVWFYRAIHTDPDDQAAYESELYYLEPKWHGSPEAILEFGRICRDSHNWRGRLPFILITAHERLAVYGDPNAYFQNPAVWQDIQSIYVPLLKARPSDRVARSAYAYWACRTQHWDEANTQFQSLGEDIPLSRFGSLENLENYRAMAKEKSSH